MTAVKGYAAMSATSGLAPWNFERRDVGADDVLIDILYCGICHSDIHSARGEWDDPLYPMVPGHEIIGRVESVGRDVRNYSAGDLVGVGVFVDSCRECESCRRGEEQYCETHLALTYNSYESDRKTPTYGGYATRIVTDRRYVLRISDKLNPAAAAPLLCAGITTYSPLRHWNVGPASRVAVVGLGGLGHMGVKFAAAFGAEVTVISTSDRKEADAREFGAAHFVNSTDRSAMNDRKSYFDFILNTVSAPFSVKSYLSLLRVNGTMTMVGLPPEDLAVSCFSLIDNRRSLAGSAIGGIKETQEMLDFCADNGIVSEIELIQASKINEAYDRVVKSDVRYRFVIDCKTI
jgi:uncharacterized zinc-type alcohol dehydrogenase-like protein